MDSKISHILGCPCYNVDDKRAMARLRGLIERGATGYTVAINAEKIARFQKDDALRSIIMDSIFPYPDGAGAVLGLKWLHGIRAEKINMPIRALESADQGALRTFIIGAKEVNHDLAIQTVTERYPNIDLVGHLHGYHSKDVMINAVAEARPQLILIAMGSPRQELFAAELIKSCGFGLAIGCGGALDILAGNVKRAPAFMVDNNLEWLYRLCKEPWRYRRQLFLPMFLLRLIGVALAKKLRSL
jgi:N-acetylglucosaminyldiphosphoundecaprenol N-acetyl-beta-D-mannosaminyltransferase